MKQIVVLLGLLLYHGNAVFCQSIKTSEAINCVDDESGELRRFKTIRYSVKNDLPSRILMFFTEYDNTSLPQEVLLRRKVLRNYGDFHLAMLEWDDVVWDDGCAVTPETFVKVLSQGETFDIIVYFSKLEDDVDFSRHILICKEEDLADPKIGLPDFVQSMKRYKFDYPYSYILMDAGILHGFIQKYGMRRRQNVADKQR